MEEQSSNQRATTESGSVIKPVPLYYYVDQFERLYQQSPMAKLFQQELTQPPNPKGRAPQEGRSRNSTKAQGFKLPTAVTRERPTFASHEALDSHRIAEEGIELKVQSGTGLEIGTGECELSRTDNENSNTCEMSESSITISERSASTSGLNEVELQVSEKPLLSPPPLLLSPSGQDEDGLRKRKATPNLHNLIKRLKSPEKTGVQSAPSETQRPPRSRGTNEVRVADKEKVDGNEEAISDVTPRNKKSNNDGQGPRDRSNLESMAGSGVSNRASGRSSSKLVTGGTSLPSLKETPIPGSSGSRRKCVPQRRLLQELRLANNQDRSHRSPQASKRNMPYRLQHADIHPGNERPVTPDASCQEDEVTPQSLAESQVQPTNQEVAATGETPVNRGSARRKTSSKRSKPDVGRLIRSLQAGKETREATPRSERLAKGTEDSNVCRHDKPEQPGLKPELLSPIGDPPGKSVDRESRGDKEKLMDAEIEEIQNRNKTKATENDQVDHATCQESTATEPNNRRITRKQAEILTNKLAVQKEQEAKLEEEKPVQCETAAVAKKPETIINRWIIKPVPSCKGVCVEGHRIGDKADQFWHSTAIMVRINPRLLATKSGALYRLAGKMDRALTMEQDFSESLVHSFQKGFPDNWRDLLHEHYVNEEKKKAKKKSSKSPWMKEHVKMTPVARFAEPTCPDSERKPKKKNQAEVTPQNLRVKDLQRSSSGRLIKPPLAYWTGQRIRHNTSLDFVEILLGTEDCTSSSVNQISLQDSLELGPRQKRAIKRTSNISKLQVSSAGKKYRHQQRKEDSDVDDGSSSYPDPESQTDRGEGHKWSVSKTKSKHSQGAGPLRQDRKGFRLKATTTGSSENVEVLASNTDSENRPLRSMSRYPQRSRRNGQEGARIERSVESCSSDYPDAATDDTASTSSTNPVDCRGGNDKHQRGMMYPASHPGGHKQPPTPTKNRAKRGRGRLPSRPQRNASVSPLYYQSSPQSEDEGSLPRRQPALGKTPTHNSRHTSDASSSTLGPSSTDPGQSSESPGTEVMDVEQERKVSTERDRSREAVGTLNLQQEILAVVEKHKQGRMARMREQKLRCSATFDKGQSNAARLPSTSDVYELSDDEEPQPKRIPYVPQGASTNTTTGESVSNWSEEGDKSVNMTWVTRAKPYRKIQGTQENPYYLTDETTTTTTTTSTTTEKTTTDTTTGETDNVVVPVRSDREPTLTETSDDEEVSSLPSRRQKKSLGNRMKTQRTRQSHQPVLDQTSDEEHVVQPQKPVSGRSSKRTTLRQAPRQASSEDTDNALRSPAIPLRLQASSRDLDETIKAPKETRGRRGRSKKALVIQRHQPKRNCKKSGSESDTNTIQEVENTGNHRRPEPVPLLRQDILNHSEPSEQSISRNQYPNRKWKGGSGITSKASVGMRTSKSSEAEEKQIEETPRREVNGKSESRDLDRDVRQMQETGPQCAARLSATKPKQLSEQQENHTQANITLTAKVGTMKRKRQLRELVEQHNRGYEDDIFDSTPFKKQKKLKIPLGEWDTEEDSQESSTGKTPGSARFKTPSVRYPGVLPLSDKKTPYSNLISPGLLPSVDRRHIDQYIHGLLKKKKGRGLTQRPYTAKQPPNIGRGRVMSGGSSLTQAMGDKAADLFDVTPMSDSDPNEERDYYWSDEEH